MTDVREIFDRILDAPAPPLTSSGDAIAAGARARRRRHGVQAVAVAVAAAMALAAPNLANPSTSPQHPDGAGAGTPTASPEPEPHRSMRLMSGTLVAAIPPALRTSGGAASEAGDGVVGAFTDIHVNGEGGQLLAYRLSRPEPAPTGDLCTIRPDPRLLSWTEIDCRTLVVNGVPVRLGTSAEPVPSRDGKPITTTLRHASRYTEGWIVIVAERRYVNNYVDTEHPTPMLTAPALTDEQLARLATNPGFLP
jgi:hypothetical protein